MFRDVNTCTVMESIDVNPCKAKQPDACQSVHVTLPMPNDRSSMLWQHTVKRVLGSQSAINLPMATLIHISNGSDSTAAIRISSICYIV